MVVYEALEHAAEHAVLKMMRWVILRYQRLVGEHESKVAATPGYCLARPDDAVGHALNGDLA